MLRTSELDYHLPEGMIATRAAEPRDAARMLVVSRRDAGRREDRHVRDLSEYLRPNDLLVLNTTRVLPARFEGVREDTGGHAEGLYLGRLAPDAEGGEHWRVLLKMRRMKPGVRVRLHDRDGHDSGFSIRLIERLHAEDDTRREEYTKESDARKEPHGDDGGWRVAVEIVSISEEGEAHARDACAAAAGLLERIGLTPLPPYIRAARKRQEETSAEAADRERYQTVYAETLARDAEGAGSVAAPTAGLHFTPELLETLRRQGVSTAHVTLHVGTGTFKGVETEFVEQHPMHEEWCRVPGETAAAIEQCRAAGGRVIAVGTTSVRTLESFDSLDDLRARGPAGVATRLLITPGYGFKFVDGMMTNFHLPHSTLMALVGAMLEPPSNVEADMPGIRRLKALYTHAIKQQYRFYSFGDAMLVLP